MREDDVATTGLECQASGFVRFEEECVALERFDAGPLASAGDGGADAGVFAKK